jgi:hypothetical protein
MREKGDILTENQEDFLKEIDLAEKRLGITERELKLEKQIQKVVSETKAKINKANALKEKHQSPDAWLNGQVGQLDGLAPFLGGKESDAYQKELAELREKHRDMKADAGGTWAAVAQIVDRSSRTMSDSLVGWMNDLDGAGRTWRTLGDTVRRVLADMILDLQRYVMQKQILEPLMGAASGFIGGLFSPKAPAASSGGSAGAGTGLTSLGLMGSVMGFVSGAHASGGSVLAGSRYLVGEQGPEIFEAAGAGRIIPNNQLGRAGGGNVSVSIVQNITSGGGSETRTSGGGAGADIWAGMAKRIEGIVKETIQKEKRLGNSLNPVFGG